MRSYPCLARYALNLKSHRKTHRPCECTSARHCRWTGDDRFLDAGNELKSAHRRRRCRRRFLLQSLLHHDVLQGYNSRLYGTYQSTEMFRKRDLIRGIERHTAMSYRRRFYFTRIYRVLSLFDKSLYHLTTYLYLSVCSIITSMINRRIFRICFSFPIFKIFFS